MYVERYIRFEFETTLNRSVRYTIKKFSSSSDRGNYSFEFDLPLILIQSDLVNSKFELTKFDCI